MLEHGHDIQVYVVLKLPHSAHFHMHLRGRLCKASGSGPQLLHSTDCASKCLSGIVHSLALPKGTQLRITDE